LGPYAGQRLLRAPTAAGHGCRPGHWKEVESGFSIEDFRMENMPARIERVGDLFKPLLQKRGRVKLESFFEKNKTAAAGVG